MNKNQVAYIGLNNLFGRVVTSLLKQSPNINNLILYDDKNGGAAKISNGQQLCKVTTVIGRDKLPMALSKANIVVIGDELFQKPSSESLTAIAQKAAEYARLIAVFSPDAILVVAASPLNFVLPIIARVLDTAGCFDPKRLLGATSCDTLRASTLLSSRLRLGPQKTILPVIGGATATTRIPLFSQANSPVEINKETKLDVIEKMKIFDGSNYSEADIIERAYASVRFTHSVLAARQGGKPIPEIAFTQNNEIPDVEYFSMPLLIGKNGVEKIMKLPKLSEFEDGMLNMAVDCLNADLEKSKELFEYLKQKTEVEVKQKAEVEVEQKAEVKTEQKAEVKTEQKAEFKTEQKAEVKSEQKTEVEEKTEVKFKSNIQEHSKIKQAKTAELDVKTKKCIDSPKDKRDCFSKSGQWSKEEDISYMDLEGTFMEDELTTRKDDKNDSLVMKEVDNITTTLVYPDRRNITKMRANTSNLIVSNNNINKIDHKPTVTPEIPNKNISTHKNISLKSDVAADNYKMLNSPNKIKLGSAKELPHERETKDFKPLLPSNSSLTHLPKSYAAKDDDNFSFFENSIDRLLKTENRTKLSVEKNQNLKSYNIYGNKRLVPNYFKRISENGNGFPKFRKALEIKIKTTSKLQNPFTVDEISELRHKSRGNIFTSDKNLKAYGIDVPVGFSKFVKSTEHPKDSNRDETKGTKHSDLPVSKTISESESFKSAFMKVNEETLKPDKKDSTKVNDKTQSQEKSENATRNTQEITNISNTELSVHKPEKSTKNEQIDKNHNESPSQLPSPGIKTSLKLNIQCYNSTDSDLKLNSLPEPKQITSKQVVEPLPEAANPEKLQVLQPKTDIKPDVPKSTANVTEVKAIDNAHISSQEKISKNLSEGKTFDPKWKKDEPFNIKDKLLEIFTQDLDQHTSSNLNVKFKLDTNALKKISHIEHSIGVFEKPVIVLEKIPSTKTDEASKNLPIKTQHLNIEKMAEEKINALEPENKINLTTDKSERGKNTEVKDMDEVFKASKGETSDEVVIQANPKKPIDKTTLDLANVEIVLGVPHKSLTTEVSQVYNTIKVEGEININPLGTWYENDKNAFNDHTSCLDKKLATNTSISRKPKSPISSTEQQNKPVKMVQLNRNSPSKEELTASENKPTLSNFTNCIPKLLANVENTTHQTSPSSLTTNPQKFTPNNKRKQANTLLIYEPKQGSAHEQAKLQTQIIQPTTSLCTNTYDKQNTSSYVKQSTTSSYKKQITNNNDRQKINIFDKQSPNNYDKPTISNYKQSMSNYQKQNTNCYERPSTNTYDKSSANNYDKPCTSSYDKQGTRNYQKPSTSSYDKQSISNYEKQITNNNDRQNTNIFDKQSANNYDKPTTNNYEKQITNSYDRQSTNIYDKQSVSNYNKLSMSNHDKQNTSNYERESAGCFDKQSMSNYDKQSTYNYEKQNFSNYDKPSSVSFDRHRLCNFDKESISNYEKKSSSNNDILSAGNNDKESLSSYDVQGQGVRNKSDVLHSGTPIVNAKDAVKSEMGFPEMGNNETDDSFKIHVEPEKENVTKLNITKPIVPDNTRRRKNINYQIENEKRNSIAEKQKKQKFFQAKSKEIINRLKANHKKRRNVNKGQMSSLQEKGNNPANNPSTDCAVKPYGFSLPVQKWSSEKEPQSKKIVQNKKTEIQKTAVLINDTVLPVIKPQHSPKQIEQEQNKTSDENAEARKIFRLPKTFNRPTTLSTPTIRSGTQLTTSGTKTKTELPQPVVNKVNNFNEHKLSQKVYTKNKFDIQAVHSKNENVLSDKNDKDDNTQINIEKDGNKEKTQNQDLCPVGTGTPFPSWTKINEDLIPYSTEFPSIVNLLKKNFEDVNAGKDLGLYVKEKAENEEMPKVKSQNALNSNKLLLNSGLENKKIIKKSTSDIEIVNKTGTPEIKIETLKVTPKIYNNDSQTQYMQLPTKEKICIQKSKISSSQKSTLITSDNKSFGPKASLNKKWELKKNSVPSKKAKSTLVLRDDSPDRGQSSNFPNKSLVINPIPSKGLKTLESVSQKQNVIPTPKPWEKNRINAPICVTAKKVQNVDKPKQKFLIQDDKNTIESKIKIIPNKVSKTESLQEMTPRNKVVVSRNKVKEKPSSKPERTEREKKSVGQGLGMSNILVLPNAEEDKIPTSHEPTNLLQILPKIEKEKIQMTESISNAKKNFVELAQSSLLESLKNSAVLLNVKEASQEVFSKRKQIIENDVYKYSSGNQILKGKTNEVGLQPQVPKADVAELKQIPKLTEILKGPERKADSQQKSLHNEVNTFNKLSSKISEINVRMAPEPIEIININESKKSSLKSIEIKSQTDRRPASRQPRRFRSQNVLQPNTSKKMFPQEKELQDNSRRRPLLINHKKVSLYTEMNMTKRKDEVQMRKTCISKQEKPSTNKQQDGPSQIKVAQKKRNGSKRRRSSSQNCRRNQNVVQNKSKPNTAVIPSVYKSPNVSNSISLNDACPLSSPAKTWGRLFNVFKQIISRDLEEEQVERMKSLNHHLPTKH